MQPGRGIDSHSKHGPTSAQLTRLVSRANCLPQDTKGNAKSLTRRVPGGGRSTSFIKNMHSGSAISTTNGLSAKKLAGLAGRRVASRPDCQQSDAALVHPCSRNYRILPTRASGCFAEGRERVLVQPILIQLLGVWLRFPLGKDADGLAAAGRELAGVF